MRLLNDISKIFKYKYHENAEHVINHPHNNYEIVCVKSIFSKEDLINGRYYMISEYDDKYNFTEKSIEYVDKDRFCKILIEKLVSIIKYDTNNFIIKSYKRKDFYRSIVSFSLPEGDYTNIIDDKNLDISKLRNLYECYKFLKHKEYEYNKKCKT